MGFFRPFRRQDGRQGVHQVRLQKRKNPSRVFQCTWLSLLIAFLFPSAAFANIPLPTLFAFGVPFWLAFYNSFLFLLAIVVVEALVLKAFFTQSWLIAFRLSFGANLMTTAIGFLMSPHPSILLFLFAVVVLSAWLMRTRLQWKPQLRIPIWIGIGAIGLALIPPQPTVPRMIIQFYLTMLYSIFLTILIEAGIFAARAGPKQAIRWSLAANGVSYILLFGFLFAAGFRSGALILNNWPIWQLQFRQETMSRGEIVDAMSEIYQWERSGSRFLLRGPRNPEAELPLTELRMVINWAEAGHLAEAEELYNTVSKYRTKPDEDDSLYDYCKDTEDAISEARTRQSEVPSHERVPSGRT